jgi:hypothetical protein
MPKKFLTFFLKLVLLSKATSSMVRLDESGMSIGDYAMSLIDSGQVPKMGYTSEVARPASMPTTDIDISDVDIPISMVEQVLQESFGMGNEAPKRETVRGHLLSEQELLQEKIISLKGELVETINKLTSLVSEMVTTAGGSGFYSAAGGDNGNSRTPKKVGRKYKRSK